MNATLRVYTDGRPDSYEQLGGTADWPPVRAGKARPIGLAGPRLVSERPYTCPSPRWCPDCAIADALEAAARLTDGTNLIAHVRTPGEATLVYRHGEYVGPRSLRGTSRKSYRKAVRKYRAAMAQTA